MNRSEKNDLAVKLRAKIAALRAAPDECAHLGEDYAARSGGPGSKHSYAFGALQARISGLAAELDALVTVSLERGRGRR